MRIKVFFIFSMWICLCLNTKFTVLSTDASISISKRRIKFSKIKFKLKTPNLKLAGILSKSNGLPKVVIMENHGYAYGVWDVANQLGIIKNGAILVHIDAHSDTGETEVKPRIKIDDVKNMTPRQFLDLASSHPYRYAQFIYPAVKHGIIGEIFCIYPWETVIFGSGSVKGSEISKVVPGHDIYIKNPLPDLSQDERSLILDIDLDFFSLFEFSSEEREPWIEYLSINTDIPTRLEYLKRILRGIGKIPDLVTISMGPELHGGMSSPGWQSFTDYGNRGFRDDKGEELKLRGLRFTDRHPSDPFYSGGIYFPPGYTMESLLEQVLNILLEAGVDMAIISEKERGQSLVIESIYKSK